MVAAKSKKKSAGTSTKPNPTNQRPPAKRGEDILQSIDAISDDDDDNDDNSIENDSNDDGEKWDQEALALRKMISDGKFNELLKRHDGKTKKSDAEKEEDAEEDEIDGDDEDTDDSEQDGEEANNDDDDDDGSKDKSDASSDDDEEDEGKREASHAQETRAKALMSAIQSSDRNLPFAESFTVVPPTPLPFGPTAALNQSQEEEGGPVDIHDDLKREVAFYDTALEAVHLAREQCEKVGIPFRRPEDFFAEMVKTDEHMAKVKDRLIFETKKIEAVQRRKSNKEQTLMAKERHAHRIAEKSKAKKDHMSAVEEWKKNAERSRGGLGGKVVDVEEEEERLRGVGKKRAAADRRYGFGGKRGRFKQNDRKTLDDMSGFKPRGGFGGVGQKSVAGGNKSKGGKKRAGKRARDAARSGRK